MRSSPTRACITNNGDGVLVFAPLHSPFLTMFWEDVKGEIESVAELSADDDETGILNAVIVVFIFDHVRFTTYGHLFFSWKLIACSPSITTTKPSLSKPMTTPISSLSNPSSSSFPTT